MRARDLSLIAAAIPLVAAFVGSAAGAPKGPAAGPKPSADASQAPARPAPRDAAARAAEKSALSDFDAANYGQAGRRLKDEVGRCGTRGCSPAVRARLLAALGLVQASGMRKPSEAADSFEQALRADPQVALPPGAPEDVRKLFEEAKRRVVVVEAPPVTAPPVTAASASAVPPPPAEIPIQPLQTLGDARWTEMGFVRPGEPPPAPSGSTASFGPPLPLKAPSALALDEVAIHLRTGIADYVPINDGKTDDVTDLKKGWWIGMSVRPEWRSVTSPVGFWFDVRFALTPHLSGAMQIPDPEKRSPRPMHGSLTHFGFGLQTGLDVVPIGYVSAGPLIGYRGDVYAFSLDDESSLKADKDGANGFFDHGLDYGGHVRLRSGDRAGKPALLFLDAALFRRNGRVLTGTYQRFELGFQPTSDFSLLLFYQSRTSASGYAGLKDIQDPADAVGYMMPLERMIGLGIGGVVTGSATGAVSTGSATGGAARK